MSWIEAVSDRIGAAVPKPAQSMGLERTFQRKCLQVIARILVTLLFDLKGYGRRNVPRHGGVLIVSNHQGNLDPALRGVRLERPLNYIANSELRARPRS